MGINSRDTRIFNISRWYIRIFKARLAHATWENPLKLLNMPPLRSHRRSGQYRVSFRSHGPLAHMGSPLEVTGAQGGTGSPLKGNSAKGHLAISISICIWWLSKNNQLILLRIQHRETGIQKLAPPHSQDSALPSLQVASTFQDRKEKHFTPRLRKSVSIAKT